MARHEQSHVDKLAPEVAAGIRVMPVVHGRMDVGVVVRDLLSALDPAAVAVELPTTLATAVGTAVGRLPKVSVVIAEDEGADALIWPVAPGDPFAVAIRWAQASGRPWHCIDPDVPYASRHTDPVPDPYILWEIGADAYLEMLAEAGAQRPHDSDDSVREAGMAYHTQQVAAGLEGGGLLVLVGAAHAHRLGQLLGQPTAQPLARLKRTHVEVRHLHPESLSAVLVDAPLAHALFEYGPTDAATSIEETVPPRLDLVRAGMRIVAGQDVVRPLDRQRAVVAYAASHSTSPSGVPDRHRLTGVVWNLASSAYREHSREAVVRWQGRLFGDFSRRYARVQGLLIPGLFEWVVAARGVADDNLAWQVFEVARSYPWQEETAEIPTARLDGSELDLGTRRIRFRRRFFRVKRQLVKLPMARRPTVDPERWLDGFDSSHICSYPPEDVVVEDYGRFLRHKGSAILAAERSRVEPFTTSMLDGIDLRETLRHVEDRRIYVRDLGRIPGTAGSVVMIFDPDPDGEQYPYCTTWMGEHDQESDMAYYATEPTGQVVGPGIMRASYGGFMMSYPPQRVMDVWNDPDYGHAPSKPALLLMAAIDYSVERTVVHVAKQPPTELLRRYAAAQRKHIVHIPLGALSPSAIKRIRVVHILVGSDKRTIAKDYV